MQVSVEVAEGLGRKVHVEVPEVELQKQVDQRLDELGRTVRLPGFRPGKVPRKVVVKRFGRQVRDEVVGSVLQESFRDALDGESLRPAGSPRIDPLSAEPGEGLKYTAAFDVYPQIELGELSDLVIKRPVAGVTDADVDVMLDKLRGQRKTFEKVERAAANGDRVRIDFEGTLDGELVQGGKAEDFPLELGSGSMVPGFESALEGASAGDRREFKVTFPDPYPAPFLAGKEVDFAVTVNAVEAAELPALDDAFAEAFGVEDGGIDRLRADVRQNMDRELQAAVRAKTQESALTELHDRRSVDVPQALLDQELAELENAHRQSLGGGDDVPAPDEAERETMTSRARQRVATGLLVAEVVRAADLKPDAARVRAHIDTIASTYEEPEAVVRFFYSEPERLQQVESQVLQEQAVDWLLEQGKVEDQPSSFSELTNPVAPAA